MSISIVSFWILVLTTVSFVPMGHDSKLLTIGVIVNINLIVFFAAPLSTIYTVITTKNSSSIHRLLMVTNTFNTVFWTIYGLVLMDPIILLPNAIGLMFGVIQIFLACWYPQHLDIDETIMRTNHFDKTVQSDAS